MKKILSLGLALSLLSACNNSPAEGITDLRVSAKGSTEIIVEKLPANSDVVVIDTLKSEDGNFEITFPIDTPNFFMVTTDGIRIPFFSTGGEQILIEVDPLVTEVDRGYHIKGNKESERLHNINKLLLSANKQVDSLSQLRNLYRDSANSMEIVQRTQKDFENILNEGTDKLIAMLEEDPANLANLFVFQMNLYNNPFLNPQQHMAYFEKADSALIAAYPNNPHALVFRKQFGLMKEEMAAQVANQMRQDAIDVGNPAPEIALPKEDGSILKLSDLRGQVVLVDFWAAWCRPCRMSNPKLVEMYNRYKDQGFTILSVSFDGLQNQQTPKQDWLKAIADDGLVWDNHISDLKGWSSAAGQAYGIQSIPYTVLVDREGNIVAKQFGPDRLPELLEPIL